MLEHVANAAGTYAHEHLNEVAAAHREEGHAGFACHSLGKQRLTRSRRAYEQGSLGYLAAKVGIFLRVLKELHDLLHLLLGSCLTGYVLEGDAEVVGFLVETGLRLAHVEHSAGTAATAHTVHYEHPYDDEQHPREEADEYVYKAIVVLVLVAVACYLLLLHGLVEESLQIVYRTPALNTSRMCSGRTYIRRLLDFLLTTTRSAYPLFT